MLKMWLNPDFNETTFSKYDDNNVKPAITYRQLYFMTDEVLSYLDEFVSDHRNGIMTIGAMADIVSRILTDAVVDMRKNIEEDSENRPS